MSKKIFYICFKKNKKKVINYPSEKNWTKWWS